MARRKRKKGKGKEREITKCLCRSRRQYKSVQDTEFTPAEPENTIEADL